MPGLAGNAVHGRYTNNTAAVVQRTLFKQHVVDAFFRRQVDVDGHVPPVFRHIGQGLVAGDTGVMHDDVATAHFFQFVGNLLWRFGGRNITQQGFATDFCHHAAQITFRWWNIKTQNGCTVARQGAGDGLTDTTGSTGHQRDFTGQRLVPVGVGYILCFTHRQHLTIDIRRLGGNHKTERGIEVFLGTGFNVDCLSGGAFLADFLGNRA